MWTASLCYFRFELWSLMAASSTLLALSWAMGRFDILSGSMFACDSSGSLFLNAQLYPQGDKNRSSGRSLGGLWLLSPWPPGTVQHLTLVWQWLVWWLPFCLWVSHWWWNMIHLWLRMPWWNWSCWRWNHCCCWGPHCGCCWCCPLVPLLPEVVFSWDVKPIVGGVSEVGFPWFLLGVDHCFMWRLSICVIASNPADSEA